jgi:hypothetical protein
MNKLSKPTSNCRAAKSVTTRHIGSGGADRVALAALRFVRIQTMLRAASKPVKRRPPRKLALPNKPSIAQHVCS